MFENRVCVLLAAYNGEKYIREQILSVLNQSESCDIFVSVDLSSDDTNNIVNDLAGKHKNINILPYGERYGSAGQNFFRLLLDVDFSGYDYIAFSDQDDIWYQSKLERAVAKINEMCVDGYSSNVTAFWQSGREKLIKKDYPQVDFDYVFESPGPGCTFVMTKKLAVAIKRSLYEKRTAVVKLWLHDWYCYAFARSRGFDWFIDGVPSMAYRQHTGNEVGANFGFKSFIIRVKSIIFGDGLIKALEQAAFLEIKNNQPLYLLSTLKRFNLFKLALLANSCRRKPLDKVLFFFVFSWFSIFGLSLDE